jgi:hypothetical protein
MGACKVETVSMAKIRLDHVRVTANVLHTALRDHLSLVHGDEVIG